MSLLPVQVCCLYSKNLLSAWCHGCAEGSSAHAAQAPRCGEHLSGTNVSGIFTRRRRVPHDGSWYNLPGSYPNSVANTVTLLFQFTNKLKTFFFSLNGDPQSEPGYKQFSVIVVNP